MAGLVVVISPMRGSSMGKPPPTDACRQICVAEVVGGPRPPWGVPPLSKLVMYCARKQEKKSQTYVSQFVNKWYIINVIQISGA